MYAPKHDNTCFIDNSINCLTTVVYILHKIDTTSAYLTIDPYQCSRVLCVVVESHK